MSILYDYKKLSLKTERYLINKSLSKKKKLKVIYIYKKNRDYI